MSAVRHSHVRCPPHVSPQASRLEEQVSKLSRGQESASEPGQETGSPSLTRRYSVLDPAATSHLQSPEWPSQQECGQKVTKFPSASEFPTVFLAPDNKGFE